MREKVYLMFRAKQVLLNHYPLNRQHWINTLFWWGDGESMVRSLMCEFSSLLRLFPSVRVFILCCVTRSCQARLINSGIKICISKLFSLHFLVPILSLSHVEWFIHVVFSSNKVLNVVRPQLANVFLFSLTWTNALRTTWYFLCPSGKKKKKRMLKSNTKLQRKFSMLLLGKVLSPSWHH